MTLLPTVIEDYIISFLTQCRNCDKCFSNDNCDCCPICSEIYCVECSCEKIECDDNIDYCSGDCGNIIVLEDSEVCCECSYCVCDDCVYTLNTNELSGDNYCENCV
jgi:hypothetical protein